VQFAGAEFIRVGSYKKRLKDFPEKERALWRALDTTPFERLPAAEKLTGDEVLRLLDYPSCFDLVGRALPDGHSAILEALAADRLIEAVGGHWNVLNVGAILLAKQLSDFGRLQRKAVRIVVYKGKGRVETLREQVGAKGYASGFEGLVGFINNLLPVNEVIGRALRKAVPVYPELAQTRAGGKCADSSRLVCQRQRADGRNLRRPHGDYQPRRALGGYLAHAGQPAPVA
jgi:predicted HTH transcriptional regulator